MKQDDQITELAKILLINAMKPVSESTNIIDNYDESIGDRFVEVTINIATKFYKEIDRKLNDKN